MGLRAGRRGQDRERTFIMEPTHETHAPGSTELDNSHYVTERLVYAPSVQPTLVQLLPVHLPPPIQVIGTPRTSGRLLDEDFASFTFGDIRASAAQITTRRIIAEQNPAAASPLSSAAVSQEQPIQIRVQYEVAESLAKTAEGRGRSARSIGTKDGSTVGPRNTRPGSLVCFEFSLPLLSDCKPTSYVLPTSNPSPHPITFAAGNQGSGRGTAAFGGSTPCRRPPTRGGTKNRAAATRRGPPADIFCMYVAYILHVTVFAYFLHISCIFLAYFLHIYWHF